MEAATDLSAELMKFDIMIEVTMVGTTTTSILVAVKTIKTGPSYTLDIAVRKT